MSCILRITGKEFDVDNFIRQSKILPNAKFYTGEPRIESKPGGEKRNFSDCNLKVSEADLIRLINKYRMLLSI